MSTSSDSEFWTGFLLTLGLHVVMAPLLSLALAGIGHAVEGPYGSLLGIYPIILISISQWLWVGPALYVARKHPASRTYGIQTMAGITVLLNVSCFGVLALS